MRTASPATFNHDISHSAHADAHHAEEVALHLPYLWCEWRSTPEPLQPTRRLFSASSRSRFSPGKERGLYGELCLLLSSFFLSFFFPLSFSFPPSPSNSTPRVLSSSLRAECGNSSLICGTRQAAWSRRRTPGCPRSTSPHRNCTRRTAGRVDGRGSN